MPDLSYNTIESCCSFHGHCPSLVGSVKASSEPKERRELEASKTKKKKICKKNVRNKTFIVKRTRVMRLKIIPCDYFSFLEIP